MDFGNSKKDIEEFVKGRFKTYQDLHQNIEKKSERLYNLRGIILSDLKSFDLEKIEILEEKERKKSVQKYNLLKNNSISVLEEAYPLKNKLEQIDRNLRIMTEICLKDDVKPNEGELVGKYFDDPRCFFEDFQKLIEYLKTEAKLQTDLIAQASKAITEFNRFNEEISIKCGPLEFDQELDEFEDELDQALAEAEAKEKADNEKNKNK